MKLENEDLFLYLFAFIMILELVKIFHNIDNLIKNTLKKGINKNTEE